MRSLAPVRHNCPARVSGFRRRLFREAGREFGGQAEARIPRQHLIAKSRRKVPRVSTGDVDAGGHLEQKAFRVLGRIDRVPHVSHHDLRDPFAAGRRPARSGAEQPGEVAADVLERDSVIVERATSPRSCRSAAT